MNPLIAKGLTGAATGFVGAFLADLDAFIRVRSEARKNRNQPAEDDVQFDWALAVARWVKGIAGGAMLALGIGGVEQLSG